MGNKPVWFCGNSLSVVCCVCCLVITCTPILHCPLSAHRVWGWVSAPRDHEKTWGKTEVFTWGVSARAKGDAHYSILSGSRTLWIQKHSGKKSKLGAKGTLLCRPVAEWPLVMNYDNQLCVFVCACASGLHVSLVHKITCLFVVFTVLLPTQDL